MQIEVSEEVIQKAIQKRVAQVVDLKIQDYLKGFNHDDFVRMLKEAIEGKITEDYLHLLEKSLDKEYLVKCIGNCVGDSVARTLTENRD